MSQVEICIKSRLDTEERIALIPIVCSDYSHFIAVYNIIVNPLFLGAYGRMPHTGGYYTSSQVQYQQPLSSHSFHHPRQTGGLPPAPDYQPNNHYNPPGLTNNLSMTPTQIPHQYYPPDAPTQNQYSNMAGYPTYNSGMNIPYPHTTNYSVNQTIPLWSTHQSTLLPSVSNPLTFHSFSAVPTQNYTSFPVGNQSLFANSHIQQLGQQSANPLSTCSQSQHIIQQSANQRAAPVYNGEQSLSASVQSTSRQQLGAEVANALTQQANAEADHIAPFTRK